MSESFGLIIKKSINTMLSTEDVTAVVAGLLTSEKRYAPCCPIREFLCKIPQAAEKSEKKMSVFGDFWRSD